MPATPPFPQVNRSYVAQQTVIQADWLNWINYVVNHPSIISSGAVNVQPALVSGVNIKTINGQNILGSGDVVITGGGGGTTVPGGANTQVQFNDSGVLAGATGLLWNKAGNYLSNPLGNMVAVQLYAANTNTIGIQSSTAGTGKVWIQANGGDATVDINLEPWGVGGKVNVVGGLLGTSYITGTQVYAANTNTIGMQSSTTGMGKVILAAAGGDATVDINLEPYGPGGAVNVVGGIKVSGTAGITTSVVTTGGTLNFTNGILTSVT